ncbi:MAG: sigma-54 dependent transcriptional regulator [Polyangiales bacterium]|nr:sigma-54-dependent Fis family transcriptional regulator [Myxococcales bacterium]MCB9659340.1 sigma-54-dependent Fis family transcriptional regulator [Sandaracinaceae bacterium]
MRVLAVDDEQSMCELMAAALQKQGIEVAWETSAEAALRSLAERDFDAVIADLNLERDGAGLELCAYVRENQPDTPVVVITGFGDMQAAIAALRAGAHDFINKPVDMSMLAHTLRRAAEHRALRAEVKRLQEEVKRSRGAGALVGTSPPMLKLYDLIQRVASADASVLICGESGTGKELVARALHTESQRRELPFVAINCAAVPANLLESELFGHVKGAFTDARTARRGLFAEADGGTVLLDEVGEMPLEMQSKLLRVLQERTVRPVGGNAEVPFDARVLAATNRDLETEVEEGRFREDLYYRLNVVQLHVPPLRVRGNDILVLAQELVERAATRAGKAVRGVSSEAARKLLDYDWPGNVRQLENCIERAVTLTRFDQITPADLPERVVDYVPDRISLGDVDLEHMLTLEALERRYIERVLRVSQGNKALAARTLGLDRRTLYRKLSRYAADDEGPDAS